MKNMILDVNLLKSKYFISLAICSVSTLLFNSCVKTKSFKEHSSLYNGKCDKIIRRQSNAKIQIDYFEDKREFYPDLIYVNCNQDSFYVFFLEGNCIKLGDSHQLKKELKYLVLLSSESVLPMLKMVFSA